MGRSFVNESFLSALGIENTPVARVDPLKCSFCGQQVNQTRATRGTSRAPSVMDLELHRDLYGKVVGFEDVPRMKAERVIACPTCSLKVQKVKFPEFD